MLLTHAEFNREVSRERIRAMRRVFPFCIVTIELLGRKQLASRRRSLIRLLHRNIRLTDYKADLGNHRFGILLVDTPEMGGKAVLQRLRELCEANNLYVRLNLNVHDPEGFEHDDDDDQNASPGDGRRRGDHGDSKWYRMDHSESGASRADASHAGATKMQLMPVGAASATGVCSDSSTSNRSRSIDDSHVITPETSPRAGVVATSAAIPTTMREGQRQAKVLCDTVVFNQAPEAPSPQLPLFLKRAVDLVGATIGLVLVSPILLVSMIVIRLTSEGSPLFRQTREGIGGKPFTIYKLRTMVADAESRQADLLSKSHRDGPAFKIEDDPRVTPIGHFLRRTCVDELPQLINVIKGDMSLVGPRPLPWHESRACERWHRRRLDIRPGMTCYWQVNKAAAESFDDWMRMDLQYVDRKSFWQDLRLILRTLLVPITGRGSE